MYKFTIIIPIFQEYNIYNIFINSLLESIEYPTQIVIIDDNSPRETATAIDNLTTKQNNKVCVEIVHHKYSHGSCRSINEAFFFIKGEIIAIMDSDIILKDKWQTVAIDTLKDSTIGGIGAVFLYPQTGGIQCCGHTFSNATIRHLMLNSLPQYVSDTIYEVQSSIFAFFITTSNIINEIGKLDENFFNGYEDIDYQMRIRKAGYKIIIHPHLQFYHWEKSNGVHREYNRRSNLGLFWRKHCDFVKEDLWDFLFRRITQQNLTDSYIGIDLCSARQDAKSFWQQAESRIPILISEHLDYSHFINDNMDIWLPQIIHYDFFRTVQPILFLCDNFVKMIGNDYWFKLREDYSSKDIIVDLYGNVISMELLREHFWPGTKVR